MKLNTTLFRTIMVLVAGAAAVALVGCEAAGALDDGDDTNGNGNGDNGQAVESVGDLAATAGDSEVALSWTDPPADAFDHIELTWDPDGSNAQSVDPGQESYTASGLTNDTVYTFTVVAVNAEGERSGEVTVTSSPSAIEPVTISYPEWAHATALTHVAEVILADNGFSVTLSAGDGDHIWQTVADGSADAMLAAWLPVTHGNYYGPEGTYTDQVEKLGANYEDAQLGLVVPSYVSADSISDLDAVSSEFGGEIQGIDPGAGIMDITQDMIDNDTYGLGDWNLIEASGPDMTTALGNAISSGEPIVVTGWRPHWKFGEWDLKLLDDPEGVYGEAEDIFTMVRQDLRLENPAAYQFFDRFDWTQLDMESVMVDIHEGSSPADAAAAYVADNQSTVDGLLPDTGYFE